MDASIPMMPLDVRHPLLADPRLVEVRQAIEQAEDAKALQMFEQVLAGVPADAPEIPHWHLWLAYAYQKHADCESAARHFLAASESTWMLREYAMLGLAQCHATLGHVANALQLAETIRAEPPLLEEVQMFRADLLVRTGRTRAAADILHDYLKDHTTRNAEQARVTLHLAELLAASQGVSGTIDSGTLADAALAPSEEERLKEVLSILDSVNARVLDRSASEKYYALKASIFAKLFVSDADQKQQCVVRNQADELEMLYDAREFKRVIAIADGSISELKENQLLDSTDGCRIRFATAQAHLALRESEKGRDELAGIVNSCAAPEDIVARALYTVARGLQDRHELARAIAGFEELEQRFPKHRLIDDARLQIAYAFLELGSESRFTECIQRLAEDFPDSDSAAEGLFQLALRAMTKSDWSTAGSVLAQLGRLPRIASHEYVEHAERQLFFLARAQQQLGQLKEASLNYERLIQERPLSYYMLSAYSRILEIDKDRARRLCSPSSVDGGPTPFSVPYQPQFEKPGFSRAMELMAIGEVQRGVEELRALRLPKDIEPLLLWSQASFEATAGAFKNSQRLVRERLRNWPRRWPSGTWEPAWKIAFPRPFLDIVTRESKRTSVPESLIYAIMREESQFDRDAVSRAEAYGLMQLILPTAKTAAKNLGLTASATTLVRPSVNVALGSQVLAKLLSKFDKLPVLAIPAYNAGPGRPARWLKERPNMDFDVWVEAIPFSETRTYVKHVLSSWATYAWLYDRAHAEDIMKLPLKMPD